MSKSDEHAEIGVLHVENNEGNIDFKSYMAVGNAFIELKKDIQQKIGEAVKTVPPATSDEFERHINHYKNVIDKQLDFAKNAYEAAKSLEKEGVSNELIENLENDLNTIRDRIKWELDTFIPNARYAHATATNIFR